MKFQKAILLICIALCLVMAVACDNSSEPNATTEKTSEVTAEPTNTPDPTVEPTETPEPTPTPIAGKLYEDATVLFKDTFDEGPSDDAYLSTFTNDLDIFTDGMLKCYRPAELFNYGPIYDLDYTAKFQYEFWADISAWYETNEARTGEASATWMGVMLGVHVNNQQSNATSNDGYWVSFSQGDYAIVYPTGNAQNGYWPNGAFKVPVGVSFNEANTIAAVDTGEQVFFYTVDKEGNQKLFLRADFSEDIKSYDAEGNLLNESDNLSKDNSENYFVLFNHISQATVDNVYLKAK